MFIKNAKVKRPKGTKIQTRNGVKYVYFVEKSVYNPDKKYVVDQRKLIGRMIDDEMMMPNEAFSEYFPNEEIIYEKEASDKAACIHLGTNTFIKVISEKIGLRKMLERYFPKDDEGEDYADEILDLASYYLINESNIAQHAEAYYRYHYTFSKLLKDDSDISEFYQDLKASIRTKDFYKEWIKNNVDGRVFVSYDSTNIPNFSKSGGVTLASYGKAKLHDEAPQINISYGINQNTGTPLISEVYNGSVNDVDHFKSLVNRFRDYGITGINFILDRGYYSKENINSIYKICSGFLMCAKVSNEVVQDIILNAYDSITDASNYIPEERVFGKTIKAKLFKDDLDGEEKYFHIYFKTSNQSKDSDNFHLDLHSFLAKVNENKELTKADEQRSLAKFLVPIVNDDGTITSYKLDDMKVKEHLKLSGFFCLISSMKLTAKEAISIYSERDIVEKLFTSLKQHLGCETLGVQTDESIQAKTFITFIAAVLRNKIYSLTKDLRLANNKDYTVTEIISQLEQIDCIRGTNGNYTFYDGPTKRQKKIMNALGINQRDLNIICSYLNKED